MFRASPYVLWGGGGGGGAYISDKEHNFKLKFSIQTHVTHMNAIFEYCHALEILNSVDVLYLEDRNVYRPV